MPTEVELLSILDEPYQTASRCEIASLIWEIGASEAARRLRPTLEPASGLAAANFGSSLTLIFAVDYFLGLLSEVLGELDEAIELHLGALEQHRGAGYILDVGYSAWQLLRLLKKRAQPGDVERGQELAAEALALLEGTQLSRVQRLINEELAKS